MIWAALSVAVAGDLEATLADVAPLRSQRIATSAPVLPAEAYGHDGVTTGLVSVEGSAVRKAWGVAVLDVEIKSLWGAINDDHSKPRVTRLSHLSVLEGEACSARRVVFQYLPVSMMSDRWWVVEQQANTALAQVSEGRVRELTWKSVADGQARLDAASAPIAADGVELPFTEGAWLLVDVGNGRTLVEYYTWSDPGGSVPAGLASRFAAGGIEDTIMAMADLARAGPSCVGP